MQVTLDFFLRGDRRRLTEICGGRRRLAEFKRTKRVPSAEKIQIQRSGHFWETLGDFVRVWGTLGDYGRL